jgi:3-oxoacyl-[acyl-carrier-protein] synthase-3
MSICITGTGSYIPEIIKKNQDFLNNKFLNPEGSNLNPNEVIIKKFKNNRDRRTKIC